MKIAYMTSHFPCGSGERFLEPEVETLGQLGLELLIVPARPRKGKGVHAELCMPVLLLGAFDATTLVLAALETVSHPLQVVRAFRHVAFARYRAASKAKNLLLFPKALAVARKIRNERVDHIHAQWLSTPSTIAYVVSMLTGIPWSCTAHQFDIFEDNLINEKASSARFIRVISTRNRELVAERIGSGLSSRCKVVHLGVTVPQRVRQANANGVLRILCPANMVPKKGHEYLLNALGTLRKRGVPFECDLAGDGPLRRAIEQQIEQEDLRARVRLRGVVAHDRLCTELSAGRYDVVVLASTEAPGIFEGIPVALMEAMAAGVPCIATDTGSISELIENGVTSILVPQRNARALVSALARLAGDTAERALLGRRAREAVQREFDTRDTSKELFALISTST